MSSKYNDLSAVIQVIGNVYNNPSLLDFTDKYVIADYDFDNEFHRIVFGSIYKMFELGIKDLSLERFSDFFESRPKAAAVYKANDGDKWVLKAARPRIQIHLIIIIID